MFGKVQNFDHLRRLSSSSEIIITKKPQTTNFLADCGFKICLGLIYACKSSIIVLILSFSLASVASKSATLAKGVFTLQ